MGWVEVCVGLKYVTTAVTKDVSEYGMGQNMGWVEIWVVFEGEMASRTILNPRCPLKD